MQPMFWSTQECSPMALYEGMLELQRTGAVSFIIFSCIENNYMKSEVDSVLKLIDAPICGAAFPNVIFESEVLQQGAIVIGMPELLTVATYPEISSASTSMMEKLERQDVMLSLHSNFLMWTDGLSQANEAFIDGFAEFIGADVSVVGGGAGSLEFVQKPCIFSNQGFLQDAAQVVAMSRPLSIGVDHGWGILDGPYLVTASDGHLVKTLNDQPALSTYMTAVKTATGAKFSANDFFNVAKDYPLGIVGEDDTIVVRDPIQVVDGNLLCVGNVSEGSMVNILSGDQAQLIQAAGAAAAQATSGLHSGETFGLTFLFDCVSRGLYLNDRFEDELEAINRQINTPELVGVLSLGEIVSVAEEKIGFLNKTTVIGCC